MMWLYFPCMRLSTTYRLYFQIKLVYMFGCVWVLYSPYINEMIRSFSCVFEKKKKIELESEAVVSVCRLAADWPETMQIVRLIAQEHMNNKFVSMNLLPSLVNLLRNCKRCPDCMCMTSFLLILQTICWQGRLSSISNLESAWVSWTTSRKEVG